MDKLDELAAASDACLIEAGYAEAEQATRGEAGNEFARAHKATLDRHKYGQ